jgi:hypothetical protein
MPATADADSQGPVDQRLHPALRRSRRPAVDRPARTTERRLLAGRYSPSPAASRASARPASMSANPSRNERRPSVRHRLNLAGGYSPQRHSFEGFGHIEMYLEATYPTAPHRQRDPAGGRTKRTSLVRDCARDHIRAVRHPPRSRRRPRYLTGRCRGHNPARRPGGWYQRGQAVRGV